MALRSLTPAQRIAPTQCAPLLAEPKNETAIAVCRRMVQAATDRNALIVWVKVKGHSGDEGNDAADKRANWAQNGGVEHEQDVTRMMDYIREYG